MLAYIVTFLAGVLSVILSRSLFRAFAPASKASIPAAAAPGAAAATTTSASSATSTQRATGLPHSPYTLALTADATADGSKGGSPLQPSVSVRSLAKHASMSRSRAAIQTLHEAADILRAQGDALAAAADDSLPSPEAQDPQVAAVAVQRFLTRKLSRQASHMSSGTIGRETADAITGDSIMGGGGGFGGASGADTPASGDYGASAGVPAAAAAAPGPVAESCWGGADEVDSARLGEWRSCVS
ncbi:hypothetical protein GPECTOR_61g813 [Gonium pectorale]|uniref:Uncharacterized protein n=1 Tax=Gonium pectorale TaxID=33097 RepID=A0A150G6A2_GONPE|nr:hypothetical protein GPECTOR_61g813 [Gonium pectorale]|eukprot:KXZ44860.1 hypothetical protein GPECTOR_61g813 [Gonium pectorale]